MGADADRRVFAAGDIAGSCALWNRHTQVMATTLAAHDQLAAAIIDSAGGDRFKNTGDGFLAEFATVDAAIDAMVEYQRQLASGRIDTPIELRSRVAIHIGTAQVRDGDRFGPTINELVRIADLVEPTHIVVTAAAGEMSDRDDLVALGTRHVRDVDHPVALFAVPLASAQGPVLLAAAGRGLPTPASALVGRGTDVARLREDLEQHRLVTVTGFGGAGKTRLSIEVAHTWAGLHGDDAHLVDLVADVDPRGAVSAAIGLQGAADPLTATIDALGDRRVLLVLDNCEHVIDEAAAIVHELLATCPGLAVLATSREPLELTAERIYPIEGLSTGAALQLLDERVASHGLPAVPVDVASELVDAVDRLPLGIELVAARLRFAEPHQIADDLVAEPTGRAARAGRDRPARHRGLARVVDWSIDLLSEPERELLARLAAFPAPVPLTSLTPIGNELVSGWLDELIARSLVVRDGPKLRLLSVVRQRVRDRALVDPPEVIDHALLAWALAFVVEVPSIAGTHDEQSARRLADQAANLDAALDAAVRLERPDDEAAILVGLWPLTTQASDRRWFNRRILSALERVQGIDDEQTVLRLALSAADHDHVDDSIHLTVIARLSEIDPGRTGPTWRPIALGEQLQALLAVPIMDGDPDVPRAALHTLHESAVIDDDPVDQLTARLFLAFSHLLHRDPLIARGFAEQASDIARALGLAPMVALADAAVALAASDAGEHETAIHIAGEAVPLAVGARWESVVRSVALLARMRRDGTDAVIDELIALIDFVVDDGVPFVIFDGVAVLAAWCVAERDIDAAHRALAHSSIARSPATCAVLWHVAEDAEFDLGLDRFTAAFEPASFQKRAAAAADHLVAERARLAEHSAARRDVSTTDG